MAELTREEKIEAVNDFIRRYDIEAFSSQHHNYMADRLRDADKVMVFELFYESAKSQRVAIRAISRLRPRAFSVKHYDYEHFCTSFFLSRHRPKDLDTPSMVFRP